MGPVVTLIRGVVLSAEKALQMTEAAEMSGQEGFGDLEFADTLTYAAPIDPSHSWEGDGGGAVVVGAPFGLGFGYEFCVLGVCGDRQFVLHDNYTGDPEAPIRCELDDNEIVRLLNENGIPCVEKDLATYIVCWLDT